MLENHQIIKDIYDLLELPHLYNRGEDNWMPLFAIARFVDQSEGEDVNAEKQLNKFKKDKIIYIINKDIFFYYTRSFFLLVLFFASLILFVLLCSRCQSEKSTSTVD